MVFSCSKLKSSLIITLQCTGKSCVVFRLFSFQSYSKWKTYRQHIVHAVDQTIAVLLEHGPISDLGSLQRDCPAEFLEGWHKHVLNDLSTQAESPSFRDSSKVILVDDNMFYRSMRYQYFQIARNCKLQIKVL